MPAAPESLRRQQLALAHWIRDPDTQTPPPGIEARRLKVYRELVRNNLDSLLSSQFPVIRRLRGDGFWGALLDDFLREHRAQTPLFPEIGQEFIAYLAARAEAGRGDPPFLPELAHYEWAELGLALAEDTLDRERIDPEGDLLLGEPVLSPLAWPLAYVWPVDRIRADHQPDTPPPMPSLFLLQRRADHSLSFSRLDPLGFALLQQLRESPAPGRQIIERLASASGSPLDTLLPPARALLQQLREREVLLGTRRA
jgi:hypothetical protein